MIVRPGVDDLQHSRLDQLLQPAIHPRRALVALATQVGFQLPIGYWSRGADPADGFDQSAIEPQRHEGHRGRLEAAHRRQGPRQRPQQLEDALAAALERAVWGDCDPEPEGPMTQEESQRLIHEDTPQTDDGDLPPGIGRRHPDWGLEPPA